MKQNDSELFDLLGDERKLSLKIEKEFGALGDNFQVLLGVEKDHAAIKIQLLKFLQKKIGKGVYITVNNPLGTFLPNLKNASVDIEKIAFIDGVTKHSDGKITEGDNLFYFEGPDDLVELNYLLSKILGEWSGEKMFVVIDSITTFLVYNDLKVIEKFVHGIVGKMRSEKISTVFITSKTADKEANDFLSQFCDKLIEL